MIWVVALLMWLAVIGIIWYGRKRRHAMMEEHKRVQAEIEDIQRRIRQL